MSQRMTAVDQLGVLAGSMQWLLLRKLHYCMLALALILLVVAALYWHPMPLIVGLLVGAVGIAERNATPNILRALEAFQHQQAVAGRAVIRITRWDSSDTYSVTVVSDGHTPWCYEFIPQFWKPVAGDALVSVWWQGESGPPVLAVTAEGAMIPRYLPRPARTANTAGGANN